MADGPPADPTQRAAVGFVDLVSFTALTDVHGDLVGADAAEALIGLAASPLIPGVRMVKSAGDGVLLEAASSVDVVDVVASIVEGVHDRGLEVRAGVADGPVIRRRNDVFGGTVNLASRLAGLARPGTIAMTRPVALEATATGRWVTPLGPVGIKGLRRAVEVFLLDPGRLDRPSLLDPVCGMRLSADDAIVWKTVEGDVGFCSEQCAEVYAEQQERAGPSSDS